MTPPRVSQSTLKKGILTGFGLAAALQMATASDLFQITATSPTVSSGSPVTLGSSSLLDLTDKFIHADSLFSPFSGSNYRGVLNYAGVQNAIVFTVNNSGPNPRANLSIPSTGLNKSFSGATHDELDKNIENYLKKDGSAEYSKFLKAMSQQSTVAVTDGNPQSSTALFVTQAYQEFGQEDGQTREEKTSGSSESRTTLGFTADVGTFDANGIKGTTYTLPLFAKFKLTDRVGLAFNMPINWTKIEGANIFGGGLSIGVPIKVIKKEKDNPWFWQVTPNGGAYASGSEDFLSGGLMAQAGLTSLLSYDFNCCTLSMGNHFSWLQGVPLDVGDITFDPGIDQKIIKNGLKLSVPLGQHFVVEGYGIHTKFLETASVDQYATFGAELGYRLAGKGAKKKSGYLKIGAYTDVSDKFSSVHAQFGTSWKF
ncbi:MAG: hypothetical protein JWN25_3278 [Verrucomicrobiales bacterium]|nr:hypothetical protein [Verrucomicrobiales bacterium]